MHLGTAVYGGLRSARVGLTVLLLVGVTACGEEARATREWTPADHGQPPNAQADDGRQAPPPAQEEGGEARAALALWNVTCAGCHGRGGRGDGPTPPPGAQMPDMTSAEFQRARTDAQLAQAITEGRNMMPAFGQQLSPKAVAALVGHIRALGGARPQ